MLYTKVSIWAFLLFRTAEVCKWAIVTTDAVLTILCRFTTCLGRAIAQRCPHASGACLLCLRRMACSQALSYEGSGRRLLTELAPQKVGFDRLALTSREIICRLDLREVSLA